MSAQIQRLADVCSSIDYGVTTSAVPGGVGPKLLRITDIVPGYIDWNRVPSCDIDGKQAARFRVDPGDIVIARTGASTGTSMHVASPPDAVFASYLVRLKIKPEHDSRFVGYLLRSSPYLDYIAGVLGDKSAQPNASARTLTQAMLRFPPVAEQRAITRVIGALDDKIELNRRMNRTLEELARAIFRSWFVDFDPVRAMAAGRAPVGMDAATAALFPAGFAGSEVGEVPEGWRVSNLLVTADVVGGGTPKTSNPDYWGGDIPWFSVVDAPSPSDVFVITTEKAITQAGLANSAAQLLPAGTTVISARGTVGRVALSGVSLAINQSCYALRPRSGFGTFGLYFSVRNAVGLLRQRSHGSVFDTITRDTLRSLELVVPPDRIGAQFEVAVAPLMEQIKQNLRETATLATTRDYLLPKLLSGEVRVEAAERIGF